MAITYATKTLAAIDHNIEEDQGARFRLAQGRVFPHMADAFRGEEDGFRSHLGASVLGKTCARQIWYGFRWAMRPRFGARMLRLFNRGHLEEARFIAMLLAIGVQVFQQDANGNQFRISDVGGHLGGSGDGVGVGIPDVPVGAPCLLEFKTHGSKSYAKLVKDGVMVAKPEHYVQMQTYMRKMNLFYAMYGAVNKDTDEIHLEIIQLDTLHADQFLDRGRQIIFMQQPPAKIGKTPAWYDCKYCDMKPVCHGGATPERNCRTCYHVRPQENGTWVCGQTGEVRDKQMQHDGCEDYLVF